MEANMPDEGNKEFKSSGRSGFLDEKLFKSRAITIFGEINDNVARSVTERLLALATANDDPIMIYISSPGGHVESGDVVYDMINFIKPEVKVIGTGWVGSAATTIFLAAKKKKQVCTAEYPLSGTSTFRGFPRRCHRYCDPGRTDRKDESSHQPVDC